MKHLREKRHLSKVKCKGISVYRGMGNSGGGAEGVSKDGRGGVTNDPIPGRKRMGNYTRHQRGVEKETREKAGICEGILTIPAQNRFLSVQMGGRSKPGPRWDSRGTRGREARESRAEARGKNGGALSKTQKPTGEMDRARIYREPGPIQTKCSRRPSRGGIKENQRRIYEVGRRRYMGSLLRNPPGRKKMRFL